MKKAIRHRPLDCICCKTLLVPKKVHRANTKNILLYYHVEIVACACLVQVLHKPLWHLGVCLSWTSRLGCASPRQAYALYKNKPPKKAKSQPCGTGRSRYTACESGPFFSHIGNAIFCPLFHRRFFSFFISTGESCFCLFDIEIAARVYLNMRFPIQIPTQHLFF